MSAEQPLSPEHGTPDRGPAPPRAATPGVPFSEHAPARSIRRHADVAGDELSEARIAEIRARIAAGVYDTREVAAELAERLLESGEMG